MRTKSQNSIVTKPVTGYMEDFTPDVNQPSGWRSLGRQSLSCTYASGSERTITYDDTKCKGKLKTTRYCDHVTREVQSVWNSESYFLDQAATTRREAQSCYAPSLTYTPLPDVASCHLEALDFFKAGCTEQQVQMPVNLLELKEIPSLFTTARKTFIRKFEEKEESFHKYIANRHLAYSFGVKPLISDIMATIEYLQDLSNRLDWLKRNSGKPVRVRFRKDISKNSTPATTFNYYGSGIGKTVCDEYRAVYQAHAVIVYDVSKLSDLEIKSRLLCRAFGFDNPLEIIWERIPYSFVVDWFLNVGDLLGSIGLKISLPFRFLDVGWSIKVTDSRYWEVERYRPYKDSNTDFYWRWRSTRYHREPGLPISFSTVGNTDLSRQQLALSLSLFAQKLGK